MEALLQKIVILESFKHCSARRAHRIHKEPELPLVALRILYTNHCRHLLKFLPLVRLWWQVKQLIFRGFEGIENVQVSDVELHIVNDELAYRDKLDPLVSGKLFQNRIKVFINFLEDLVARLQY